MKLIEIETLLNDSLKSLTGLKVDSFREFTRLKSERMSEIAQEFGLIIDDWSLKLELNNETGDKHLVDIFAMLRDTRNDRLFIFNESSTICDVKVTLIRHMQKYANVDIANLNTLYSRDCVTTAIQRQKWGIEQQLKKLNEEQLVLAKLENEFEKIEQDFLELAITL